MKFRFHRGLLADSMATQVEFEPTIPDIKKYVKDQNFPLKGEITVEFYCFDHRIQQDCFIVTDLSGVIGFTDSLPK